MIDLALLTPDELLYFAIGAILDVIGISMVLYGMVTIERLPPIFKRPINEAESYEEASLMMAGKNIFFNKMNVFLWGMAFMVEGLIITEYKSGGIEIIVPSFVTANAILLLWVLLSLRLRISSESMHFRWQRWD
ncbi:MAG: hypothetical protein D4R45_03250 [Planctomycetaceae bacterium]|nr:MAG: hypothetical protein D4R45_03250 [Planctomycetaceae bacterium]